MKEFAFEHPIITLLIISTIVSGIVSVVNSITHYKSNE